jgi:hypothetical protein
MATSGDPSLGGTVWRKSNSIRGRRKAPASENLIAVLSEGAYQLTAYDPAFDKKMEKAEDIVRRYRNTLHVLAK